MDKFLVTACYTQLTLGKNKGSLYIAIQVGASLYGFVLFLFLFYSCSILVSYLKFVIPEVYRRPIYNLNKYFPRSNLQNNNVILVCEGDINGLCCHMLASAHAMGLVQEV